MLKFTPQELKRAIELEDDFGHEMRIREILKLQPSLEIEHGGAYTDPIQGKPRDYDFRCEMRGSTPARRVAFAIEGKNLSPDAPLVISGTSRVKRESFHDWMESEKNSDLTNTARTRRFSQLNPIYPTGEFVGKSILRFVPDQKKTQLQRGRQEESDLYARWSQAISSAHDLCAKAALAGVRERVQGGISTIVLPIVAVPNGTLWKMPYTGTGIGGGDPEPVDELQYFIGHCVTGRIENVRFSMHLSHLHFITMRGLSSLLAGLSGSSDKWHDWFERFDTI